MRYFRSEAKPLSRKEARRALRTSYTAEEKKRHRKARFFSLLTTLLFWTVSALCFLLFLFFFSFVPEAPDSPLLSFLRGALFVVYLLITLFVSLLLGLLPCLPLWEKTECPPSNKEAARLLHLACRPLRESYGVKKPLLVTKCYDSSDTAFCQKDVLLFFVENELRLTANLKHGFYDKEGDLGCYAFACEEVTLREEQKEKLRLCILETEGVRFALGKKAKRFIETKGEER